nr:MAG TPA: tail protein [Caudoviricetes sp.]
MANCQNSNERLFGGAVVLEVADGCPDVKPLESEWKSLAAGTSKGFDFNPNTVTSDADDGGGYVETIITNSDLTFSFEGEVRKKDKLDQYGVGKFIKYFSGELKAKRQTGIWVRMEYGPVEFIGYMNITALSSDGGTNDIVTFSTEFKVGDASTIEVNEISDVAVTGVTVTPTTSTGAAGGIPSSQLWLHTQSGLGGNSETNWVVNIWKVDNDNNLIPGTEQTFTYRQTTPHDYMSETFNRTDKLNPAGGFGRYAITFQRTDNSSDASKLQVEEIHAVNVRTNVVHAEDSLVMVKVRATENATSGRDRKYNALITRHVISYNMTTQQVDYTLRPSRKFADIALFNWLVVGQQPESSIDIYGLYQIQAEIDAIDPRLGYFDFTFDDEDVSLGSRMETICDAASVSVYDDNGVLSFTRDSKKTSAATIFNRSNTRPDGYSLSYDMTLPGGYDGVEVQYRNPDTNKQDFVRYRISGNSIIEGSPAKAKKFEMLYVRNRFQADERALRECKRLIYSRMTMKVTAMADGEWVNIGDMVQVPDTYDTNQQAGYIVSRVGNDFETSERINFSGTMFVQVTDSSGATTARYPASPRADTAFGFTAAIPNIDLNLFDGIDVQSPSRYVIATSQELDAGQWTITAKQPDGKGSTALTLAEYSDLIYQ